MNKRIRIMGSLKVSLNSSQKVVGSLVLLQSGDKIPADGVLIHGSLRVNNSALNGETEECPKTAADGQFQMAEDITGDTFVDAHSLFRSAIVFDGEGVMEVRRVGLATMMATARETASTTSCTMTAQPRSR